MTVKPVNLTLNATVVEVRVCKHLHYTEWIFSTPTHALET